MGRGQLIAFADIQIDRQARELRRGGGVVNVEPQVFDVLLHLIEHRDRVVSKLDLFDAVWQHRFVSESALTSRIKTARRVIGDSGRDQRMIRTVHGKGYRFIAPLRPGGDDGDPGEPAATALAADPLAALAAGRGSGLLVEAGDGLLRELREQAVAAGIPVGHGSARFSALRSYGCVVDALDELVSRHPALLDALVPACREELDATLARGVPTRRQRWHLAVRDLVVEAAHRFDGVVLVLDDVDQADADTVTMIAFLGELARHHPILVAAGARPGTLEPAIFPPYRPGSDRGQGSDPASVGRLPDDVAEALELVSLLQPPFDLDTLQAALDRPSESCLRLLDICDRAGVLDQAGGRYRIDLGRLDLPGAPAHRRRADHRLLADRLLAASGEAARVAHHLLESGHGRLAVPHVLTTAAERVQAGLHREALAWIEPVLAEAGGHELGLLHALRGDALAALGDPAAVAAYRQAIRFAAPEAAARLRVRLARALLVVGDLPGAQEAVAGLAPDGGPLDGEVRLARGMVAYFGGDLDRAEAEVAAARDLALAPGAPAKLLDVITLQGLIDHSRGRWSDRLFRELRNHDTVPEIAATVFDCHLCVAEYLLYGPTPYREVVALADRLRAEAEARGAQRGAAFAVCVAGEAELLAGNLDRAGELLTRSVELHRQLVSDTGLAHSLQRLAEVELAGGDPPRADALAREALGLARWSPLSKHLMQRIYGTLVAAAPDAEAALGVVDEATQVLDETTSCLFCQVMFCVPAAVACAEGGRPAQAARLLAEAEQSASLWQGTAWQGAVAEARAALARAGGDDAEADRLLAEGARAFERAGQPIDAERCREARRGS